MPIASALGLKLADIEKMPNIEEIIKDCEQPDCEYYSRALNSASRSTNDYSQKKVLDYLYCICGFYFENDDMNRGLVSRINFELGKVELSEIIDDVDIEILNNLKLKICNPDILARIYDCIWCSRKKDYKSAIKAVEKYFESVKILVNIDFWPASIERIKRAVILGKTVNKRDLVKEIISFSIDQAENNSVQTNSFFAIQLAEFLSEQRELKTFYNKVIFICDSKGYQLRMGKDYFKASDYYRVIVKICHDHSDFNSEKKYLGLLAETEIEHGEQFICGDKKSYFNAVHHYQIAAEAFKKAGLKDRYVETHMKLLEYEQQSLSELKIHSYNMGFNNVIEENIKLFEPLDLDDSLITFAKLFRSPTEKSIKNYIQLQKQFVFKSLLPKVQLDSKGRTIAIADSTLSGEMTEKVRKQIAFEHFHNHWSISYICLVSVFIRHVSTLVFTKADIRRFVEYNPLIEPGREDYFVNGIYACFHYDYALSLHLLVPQIENMFRFILYKNGILTTKIENGLQEDMDINQLLMSDMQRKELENILGKDMILDFEGLLIGRIGLNFRNKLAHGLLGYDECFSAPAIYLCTLILKVIILGWLIIHKEETSNNGQQKDNTKIVQEEQSI